MSDVQEALIREYSEVVAKTVTDHAIEAMKGTPAGLSGDDSGLSNAWEELCVQAQGEQSVFWDVYIQTMDTYILVALEALPERDRKALWLQTENGWSWHWDVEHPEDGECDRPEFDASSIPFDLDDVLQYVFGQYVLPNAENYSNKHIRSFLGEGDENWEDEDNEDNPIRERLIELMPRESIVFDLWNWDIHFENETFIDLTKDEFENDETVTQYAKSLAEDFLGWIDEYDMDYNQQDMTPEEFEAWIQQESFTFMQKWRQNVKNEFGE